jgi:integrase
MKAYWKLIVDRPGIESAALRLHLLTGGQRIEQFIRLKWADVGNDAITLFDGKCWPSQGARPHHVPLVSLAATELKQLEREGEYVFSTTKGKKPISARTLTGLGARDCRRGDTGFQLKRIRSGVETLLAREGISREVRGHLQSHGLTGVRRDITTGTTTSLKSGRHLCCCLHCWVTALLWRLKNDRRTFGCPRPRYRSWAQPCHHEDR